MGVSKQQVNRWCNDRQGMTMETAKNIASLVGLNCSDELYEWKRIPSRN
ncbi:helix-turn-helix domain-containing protein [Mesobacillus subterraneus]|nr:helix-turn-helix domain-containing protein [Mesobacillus subterraneus]